MNNEKGFSLIETLISLAIMFFVIAAILSGFSNQLSLDNKNAMKNLAVALAESTMENYLQMSSTQITTTANPQVDYFVEAAGRKLKHYVGTPPLSQPKQMRCTVTWNPVGRMVEVNVKVEYLLSHGRGSAANTGERYQFSVNLNALRGL